MTSPDPSAAPARPSPSMAATVLAVLPPLVYPVAGLTALAVVLRGGLMRSFEEAGWSAYLVLLAVCFASLASAVIGAVSARGVRVPTAVGLFVVVLPWICGLAGMRLGMHQASRAVAFAEAASRATMIARGLSEAINARILGAWSTAGLAAALALSLAIGAAGQRAENRKWAFAAVGLALALPVLAVSGYVLFSHLLGRAFLLVALLAVGTLVTLPVAAGAAAGDAPHGRAAALSSSAVVMLFVAWLAGVAACGSQMLREAFGAIASVDPSNRVVILADAIAEMRITAVLGWVGGGSLALAALAVAGWATTRARPSAGRLAGGAALAVVTALVLVADVFVRSASENDVATAASSPWRDVAGFSAQHLVAPRDSTIWARGETLVLGMDGLSVGHERVATPELATEAGVARVAALVRTQLHAGEADDEAMPDWLRQHDDDVYGGGAFGPGRPRPRPRPSPGPAVAVAIDRRVGAATLRAFARGAAQGGAHSLSLTGIAAGSGDDDAARVRIAADSPALAALLEQTVAQPLLLESSLPAGYADTDTTLWHATVTATPSGEIAPRAGARQAAFPYPAAPRDDESIMGAREVPDAIVYVALADDATADSLAAATGAATARTHQPLLVVGEIPGHLDQPMDLVNGPSAGVLALLGGGGFDGLLGDDTVGGLGGLGLGGLGGSGDGTIGLGNLGQIGHGDSTIVGRDGPGATVRTSTPEIRGSLSPEVIQRVVRRHINEVRYCYESALAQNPELAGRLDVRFIITASGTVASSEAVNSTLGDTRAQDCMVQAVRRWMFPSPEGGGVVVVTYPFTFEHTELHRVQHGGGEGYGS